MLELELLAEMEQQARVIPNSWKKVQHRVLATEVQEQGEKPKQTRDITRASDARSEWQETRYRVGHAVVYMGDNDFFPDSGLFQKLILLLKGQ